MSKLVITGRLLDNNSEPVRNNIIHLYDNHEKMLSCFKTTASGTFITNIDNVDISQYTFVFKRCEEIQDEYIEVSDANYTINVDPNLSSFYIGDIIFELPHEKEDTPINYTLSLGLTTIKSKLVGISGQLKYIFRKYTTEDIQKNYGFDQSVPLTGYNTFMMLLNGICPIYFKKVNSSLLAEINWDNYNFDKLASLPNVRVYFDKDFALTRLELQYRKTFHSSLANSDKEPVKVYFPYKPNFKRGLRVANSCFAIFGETVYHLGIGHFYGATYSQNVHDYLSDTILIHLLKPHCKYIRKITFEIGNNKITGQSGVLNVSALTADSINQLIYDTQTSLNPFTFKPREPLCESHHFAKAQQISYKIIRKCVREFLDIHRDSIIKDWKHIHLFYLERHRNSPFYKPWFNSNNNDNFIDSLELGGSSLNKGPRSNVPQRTKYLPEDPEVKAMPWIARDPEGPSNDDFRWIELDISYHIHLVTFYHSWVHRSQHYRSDISIPITDLNFTPITTNNYGKGLNGGISNNDAELQESILRILADFPLKEYSVMEMSGVYYRIVEEFGKVSDQLVNYSINPTTDIQSSTVI